MLDALARRHASTMTSNSIRLSLAGGQVGWTINVSRPRMFSRISTVVSPSENLLTWALANGTCRWRAISAASCGCALPENNARLAISNGSPHQRNDASGGNGWGGRTRTCASRDQNPLPYQLGYTPILFPLTRAGLIRTGIVVIEPGHVNCITVNLCRSRRYSSLSPQ